MISAPAIARGRLHYGWVVFGVTFLTLLVAAGVRATPGVLIVPLQREFGWSRATVSLAVSINLVLYGLLGPFAAALMDRFGARRVSLGALSLLAIGVGLTTQMRAPWQLDLLWGVVVGVGSGSAAGVLGAWISNRWFDQRRGLVMGMLTASQCDRAAGVSPGTRPARRDQRMAHRGAASWRWPCVAIPLVAFSCATTPGTSACGRSAHPQTFPTAGPAAAPEDRRHVRRSRTGLRSKDFWLLAGTFFICGASTNGLIGTHLIPACMDVGIPEVTAAGLLASIGVFDMFGTTVSGWLPDRWNSRYLLCWYYGLRGLSLLFLPVAFGAQLLFLPYGASSFGPKVVGLAVFAVFYGLDWVATVPPTVRLTADLFGPRERGADVRLDLRGAPARRGDGGVRRRRDPHVARRVSGGVHELRPALPAGGRARAQDRPPHRAPSRAASGARTRPGVASGRAVRSPSASIGRARLQRAHARRCRTARGADRIPRQRAA